MAYVIIVIVLLAIIAPVIAILPSAKQKAQMQMRKVARSNGVSVELTAIDDPNPHQQKYLSNTGKPIPPLLKVVAYKLQRRRLSDWRRLAQIDWSVQRLPRVDETAQDPFSSTWCWLSPCPAEMSIDLQDWIKNQTASLPEDVEKIEELGYQIAVYWHERTAGSEESVINFLKTCASLPLHQLAEDDNVAG